jgi:hypothetical protein
MVKVYIGLLENASKWIAKTEDRLSHQDSLSTLIQLPSLIKRVMVELEVCNKLKKSFYCLLIWWFLSPLPKPINKSKS